jgi:hypothetical protein
VGSLAQLEGRRSDVGLLFLADLGLELDIVVAREIGRGLSGFVRCCKGQADIQMIENLL